MYKGTTTGPYISTIIPCYNRKEDVAEAIESALAQQYQNTEVIVIDDGSTDGTPELLGSFEPHIAWRTGPNRGACHARNKGLGLARGEYVQFLDSDDVLLPSKLQSQVAVIAQSQSRPDLVAGSYVVEGRDGSERRHELEPGDDWMNLIEKKLGITSSNLWRKECVLGVGGWDVRMRSSQEAELMFRMLRHDPCVLYDNYCGTRRRERSDSIRVAVKDSGEQYWRLRADILRHLHESGELIPMCKRLGYQRVFHQLRMLYAFEPKAAVELHAGLFPEHYLPSVDYNSIFYVICYKLLGFELAESVRGLVRGRH